MTAAAPRDELADLRRRAYGPGGAADDVDLDRLQRLEDALRVTEEDEDEPVDPSPTRSESESDASAAVEPEGPADPPPRATLREALRRRRVLVVLVAVAIVAAVVSAIWGLTRSDGVILRRVAVNDTAAQELLAGSLRNYGLDTDSYVQFESFERFSVWTARIPDRGLRCLLIVDEEQVSSSFDGLQGYSCTPEGLQPTVDLVQNRDRSEEGFAQHPVGSVARFVFLGDRVDVTVADARPKPEIPTPAPR